MLSRACLEHLRVFAARLQLRAGLLPDTLFHQTENKIRSKTGILRGFSPHFPSKVDVAPVYTNGV